MCVIFGTCCPLWFENEIIRCEMLSNVEKRDWNKRHIPWENDSYSQKRSPINSRPKVKQKLWNCREGQQNDTCGLPLRIFPWENDMIPNPQNSAPVSCDTRQARNFASRSLLASLAAHTIHSIYILTFHWLPGVKLTGWRAATCFYSAALITNRPVAKSLTTEVTSILPEDVDMKPEFRQNRPKCWESQQNDPCALPLGIFLE